VDCNRGGSLLCAVVVAAVWTVTEGAHCCVLLLWQQCGLFLVNVCSLEF
jgi:hypothetical protein